MLIILHCVVKQRILGFNRTHQVGICLLSLMLFNFNGALFLDFVHMRKGLVVVKEICKSAQLGLVVVISQIDRECDRGHALQIQIVKQTVCGEVLNQLCFGRNAFVELEVIHHLVKPRTFLFVE